MKDLTRRAAPARTAEPDFDEKRPNSRITLELLDVYTAGQESRGYDPYNAGDGRRAFDAWRNKPKRR